MSDQFDYSADAFSGPLTEEQHARVKWLTAEIARMQALLDRPPGRARPTRMRSRHDLERAIGALEVELRALLTWG